MAGHHKWSKVKRLKGALDAKPGKLFSKLAKELTLPARTGGGSPDGNPQLRSAVQAARGGSMGETLRNAGLELRKAGLEPDAMKLTYVADNYVTISDEPVAAQFLRLSDALEDYDVQHVYAHTEIAGDLSKIGG
jgi:transcriptional/translational regulatory protein YebC/TACO1